MTDKIIVVDDEREIADLIGLYLENDGYEVKKFQTGEQALRDIDGEEPALAVLDVMLPDTDGFTLLRRIREEHSFPVIMLTARVTDSDKILGLTMGADDYITKPFNPLELTARVKTVLRRCRRAVDTDFERDIRGLTINKQSRRCLLFGEALSLTPTEFDILWYLCENAGRVVTSEELFRAVWKEKYLSASSNTVMAHIGRLREKMHEPPRKPRFVKTVWGVGYEIEK